MACAKEKSVALLLLTAWVAKWTQYVGIQVLVRNKLFLLPA